jgi:hypothetical protein
MKRCIGGLGQVGGALLAALAAGVACSRAPVPAPAPPAQSPSAPAASQAAEAWSPERMAADPMGYLAWAVAASQQTEQQLGACLIDLRTQRGRLERERTAGAAEREASRRALQEAKEAYRLASDAGNWPAVLRGERLDEDRLKSRIVREGGALATLTNALAAGAKAQAVIEHKEDQVAERLAEVRRLRGRLATELEIARANRRIEDLGALNAQVAGVMDASALLVANRGLTVTLDELATAAGQRRVDEEFKQMMQPAATESPP